MVELLLWIGLGFLVIFVVGGAIAFKVAVNWSNEHTELKQYGTEVSGRVLEKRTEQRRGARSSWIRYEYVDQFGVKHRSRRNLVTPEAWEAHEEGGPIQVIYSQRRPKVSWPKYLLDVEHSNVGKGRV